MSFKPINVRMSAGEPGAALPVSAMIQRLLADWAPLAFEPFSMIGLWNGETVQRAELSGDHWQNVPLWRGEIDCGGPLTAIETSDPERHRQLWADCGGGEVGVRLVGALRHRPPLLGFEDAWYGRAKLPASADMSALLLNLLVIAVEWGASDHHVVVSFPLSGYPLSAVSPVVNAEETIEPAHRLDIVEENRHALFRWIGRLPAALGLRSDAVEWEINVDAALLDDDAAALTSWEQWLRGRTD